MVTEKPKAKAKKKKINEVGKSKYIFISSPILVQ